MKPLPFLALATAAILFSSCERHPASQTVPGYAEKQAARQAEQNRQATTPQDVNPNPPRFFPPGK